MSLVVFYKDDDHQIVINSGHAVGARVEAGWLTVRWRDGGESRYSGELAARLWTKLTTGAADLRTGQTYCEGFPFPEPPRIEVDNDGQMKIASPPGPPRIEPDPAVPTKTSGGKIRAALDRIDAKAKLMSDADKAPRPAADRTSDTFVRAKVSTPIPSGTFKSPSSTGCAHITHWVNCAWMSEMSSVQVWNDNTLTAPIPVGTVVKLGRLGDQWWLLAASCTPEVEEPAAASPPVDPIPSFHGSPRPERESRWPDVRFLLARDLRKFLWEVDQLPPQEREAWEIYYTSMGRLGC